jgi:uncharacterized membrane protein
MRLPLGCQLRRDRLTLAAMIVLLGGSGVLHFAIPEGYRRIVPHALGHEREIVALSGAAEIGCAAMMLAPRTRRSGGWLTAALLVAIFPANVQMALDGGMAGAGFPLRSAAAAWARLPLQLPLVWAALRVAHLGGRPAARCATSTRPASRRG